MPPSGSICHKDVATDEGAPTPPPTPRDPFAYLDTPIEMMYLEFRTNPSNNCGAVCALAKVATVLSGSVGLSWKVGTTLGTTFYNSMVAIDPDYGYDLMTQYGEIMAGNGLFLPGGAGFFQDSDGTWYDGNGNVVPDPNQTTYGIPANPNYYPPYTNYDPFGDCLLLGVGC